MWQEVPWEGYDVGDWVEVLSRGQKNTPRTGVIREMEWEPRSRSMRYYIDEAGSPVPNAYAAEDLRRVEPVLPVGDPAAAVPVIEPTSRCGRKRPTNSEHLLAAFPFAGSRSAAILLDEHCLFVWTFFSEP